LIVNWSIVAILFLARVVRATIVIIALSGNDTSNASLFLIAFSKPIDFFFIGKQDKVSSEKCSICGATARRIRASARSSICGWSANVISAFIVIITLCNVSAISIFWGANVLSAWIFVVTMGIEGTFWLVNTTFLSISGANFAIAPKIRIGIRAVSIEFTFV